MKDKVVLITGGNRGIGLATAKEFIKLSAKVICLHKSKTICSDNNFHKEIITDISDEKQVKETINLIIEEFGKIDVLVNNAGIAIDKDWDERTVKDWQETLNTNLIGTYLVSKYVGQYMLKNKYGGGKKNHQLIQY